MNMLCSCQTSKCIFHVLVSVNLLLGAAMKHWTWSGDDVTHERPSLAVCIAKLSVCTCAVWWKIGGQHDWTCV